VRTAAVGTCRAVGVALLPQSHDNSSEAVVTLVPALSSFTATMPTGTAARSRLSTAFGGALDHSIPPRCCAAIPPEAPHRRGPIRNAYTNETIGLSRRRIHSMSGRWFLILIDARRPVL
jgi:hypothetical protein